MSQSTRVFDSMNHEVMLPSRERTLMHIRRTSYLSPQNWGVSLTRSLQIFSLNIY